MAWPPGCGSFSKIRNGIPASRSSSAALMPVSPAPRMATGTFASRPVIGAAKANLPHRVRPASQRHAGVRALLLHVLTVRSRRHAVDVLGAARVLLATATTSVLEPNGVLRAGE